MNSDLTQRLDVILWNPAATIAAVESVCEFARLRELRAVCVNSSRVGLAAARLEGSDVQAVALIGFPLGTADADAKRYETELAFDLGAQEAEVVLGLGQIKDGNRARLLRELRDIVAVADERPLSVTFEAAQLSPEEQTLVCETLRESGFQGVCTSTDFWPDSKVSADNVRALREALGPKLLVKAAGGIRGADVAQALLDAGAARIGSTSAAAWFEPMGEGH